MEEETKKIAIDEAISLLHKEGFTVLNKDGWKILPLAHVNKLLANLGCQEIDGSQPIENKETYGE